MILSSSLLSIVLVAITVKSIRSSQQQSDNHKSCIFENCLCSLNSLDNSYDVKCIYDINSGTSNSRFPQQRRRRTATTNTTNDDDSSGSSISEINIMLVNRYNVKRIPDDTFANLSIRTLIMAENDLEVLNRGAFAGIRSLRMLHLIEKKLSRIEPGVFEPLGAQLTDLGLVDLVGMSSPDRVDELFRDVLYLERLASFKLNRMRFDFFKDEWMASLGNLSYLSLASNRLQRLSVDLFEFSSSLISLDLNDNELSDVESLFASLQPVQRNLKELKLSANGITNFARDFPAFESLEYLDLSKNRLSWLPPTTFRRLARLNYLHLESNGLRSLHPAVFAHLGHLLVLNLANNRLNATPNINELVKLQSLDLSNQSGELKWIDDFAFERVDQTTMSSKSSSAAHLSIDLNRNDAIGFGERAFCSRHQHRSHDTSAVNASSSSSSLSSWSQVYDLTLTYSTVKLMNRCLWRQLGSLYMPRASLKVVPMSGDGSHDAGLIDFSDVCNCHSKAYALAFNVELGGLCTTVTDSACFAPNSYTRLSKEEFICDERFICSAPYKRRLDP